MTDKDFFSMQGYYFCIFVIEFSIVDNTAVKAAAQCEEDTLFIAAFKSGVQ